MNFIDLGTSKDVRDEDGFKYHRLLNVLFNALIKIKIRKQKYYFLPITKVC